jgi:cobalt/nickel transport system permease protein
MPYGLNIALPAMLLQHIFGYSILEAVITALIFGYIQKTDASLLYGEKIIAVDRNSKKSAPA